MLRVTVSSSVYTAPGTLIIAPGRKDTVSKDASHLADRKNGFADERAKPEIVLRRGNTETFASAEQFREQQQFSPSVSKENQTAINAYKSLAVASQRSEIEQMMGVDTYA